MAFYYVQNARVIRNQKQARFLVRMTDSQQPCDSQVHSGSGRHELAQLAGSTHTRDSLAAAADGSGRWQMVILSCRWIPGAWLQLVVADAGAFSAGCGAWRLVDVVATAALPMAAEPAVMVSCRRLVASARLLPVAVMRRGLSPVDLAVLILAVLVVDVAAAAAATAAVAAAAAAVAAVVA